MPALYFDNNGVTCCTPLRTTQPSGHYLGVSVSGTPYYVQLNTSSTHPLKVDIGGTQYAPITYPENTDLLITQEFACKSKNTTCALCFYANGTQIFNSPGTACCNISIPDNSVITICSNGRCEASYTMCDGYLALNLTEGNFEVRVQGQTFKAYADDYDYDGNTYYMTSWSTSLDVCVCGIGGCLNCYPVTLDGTTYRCVNNFGVVCAGCASGGSTWNPYYCADTSVGQVSWHTSSGCSSSSNPSNLGVCFLSYVPAIQYVCCYGFTRCTI